MTNYDTFKVANLYNNRFDEFGRNIKTVGWGSHKDQLLRFEVLFRDIDPTGKRILDVGCGLGDLIPYLNEKTGGNYTYVGVDIAEKLIEEARKTYTADNICFHIGDIFSIPDQEFDLAVLSGALSYKSQGLELYAKRTLAKMFSLSIEASCLNFLTKYVDFELEKNQHYEPEEVFRWAKKLTPKVNILHDYPLYEFTIQLFKN